MAQLCDRLGRFAMGSPTLICRDLAGLVCAVVTTEKLGRQSAVNRCVKQLFSSVVHNSRNDEPAEVDLSLKEEVCDATKVISLLKRLDSRH